MYKVDIATEMPCDDWHVSWRMAISLPPCTLVRLVAFGYKYGLRSDLGAPNFKIFSGGPCPQTPLGCACLCTHHHRFPPNLKYLLPPLLVTETFHQGQSFQCKVHYGCPYKSLAMTIEGNISSYHVRGSWIYAFYACDYALVLHEIQLHSCLNRLEYL